jgi:hypothetical protein
MGLGPGGHALAIGAIGDISGDISGLGLRAGRLLLASGPEEQDDGEDVEGPAGEEQEVPWPQRHQDAADGHDQPVAGEGGGRQQGREPNTEGQVAEVVQGQVQDREAGPGRRRSDESPASLDGLQDAAGAAAEVA